MEDFTFQKKKERKDRAIERIKIYPKRRLVRNNCRFGADGDCKIKKPAFSVYLHYNPTETFAMISRANSIHPSIRPSLRSPFASKIVA